MVFALAMAMFTLNAPAQDAGGTPPPPPAGGEGPKGGGPGHGGFHILPPHAVEQLNLTPEQKKQIADLEADVKAKLEKILTPEQLEQLKKMRPPHPGGQGGPGSPGGPGGPKGGGPGDGDGKPPVTSGTNS